MDDLINHLQVTTQPVFDKRGNVTSKVQYSYFIGDHGPFIDVFDEGADTVEAVMAKQQERCAKLRSVGALPNNY